MAATLTPELHQLIAEDLVNDISHEEIIRHLSEHQVSGDDAKNLLDRVVALRMQALNMPVIGQDNQFKPQAGQVAGIASLKMTPAPEMLPVPVPDPMKLHPEQPHGNIVINDENIKVVYSSDLPRVIIFEDVLTDEECDHLINIGRPALQRSTTVNSDDGSSEVNPNRTSEGAYLARGQTEIVARIEKLLADLSGWPISKGEGMQVMRYAEGQEYKPHYDYFDPKASGTAGIIQGPGQRVATFLMYLNTPEGGGETVFPAGNIRIKARKGTVVFFSYDRPSPDTKSLHGGASVTKGEKWIATKWLRERDF